MLASQAYHPTMPTVQSAGVRIQYEVQGDGPPIVLVHGFSSSFDGNWRGQGWVEFLVGDGRKVIGLDCRGHGSSEKPHDPAAYAGHKMPDDVIAVLDDLGLEQVDLMGYSMGGWITVNLLSRHAGRFRSAIVGGAGLRTAAADPARRALMAAAFEATDPSTIADEAARNMRRRAESRGNDLAALAALQRSERGAPDASALSALRLPVLVVCGDDDPALESARALAQVVPGAKLEVLPGENHLSAVPAAQYKSAVKAFLGEVSPVKGKVATTR
jgi:pimeloyl-ACP methyl ester carboxylesterase